MKKSSGLSTREDRLATRRVTDIMNENPKSHGLDIASEHSRPFEGTIKARPSKKRRKPGEVFRP